MALLPSNSFDDSQASDGATSEADGSASEVNTDPGMLDLEAVQRALNRSRASIYRYANTDPMEVNPPFNPKRLNPEYRKDPREALMFHPNEVARFAQDVLKIKQVTVEVLSSPHTATQNLLEALLEEARAIRRLLESGQSSSLNTQEASHLPGEDPLAGS